MALKCVATCGFSITKCYHYQLPIVAVVFGMGFRAFAHARASSMIDDADNDAWKFHVESGKWKAEATHLTHRKPGEIATALHSSSLG